MTQEDKELLIKDLCARLPYGVKFCFANSNTYTIKGIDLIVTDEGNWEYAVTAKGIDPIEIKYVKPYLRPMSSMTEDEHKHLSDLYRLIVSAFPERTTEYVEYLDKRFLDHRRLIEKGLAIEAPEGMYNME